MAEFAFVRGFFLIILFPPIIAWGRRMMPPSSKDSENDAENDAQPTDRGSDTQPDTISQRSDESTTQVDEDEESRLLPTDPAQFDLPSGEQVDQEPLEPVKSNSSKKGPPESPAFDLVFLRWSLVVDGVMTCLAAFSTRSWHIYLGPLPHSHRIYESFFLSPTLAAACYSCHADPCSQLLSCSPSARDPPRPPRASSRRCARTPSAPTPSTP